MKRFTQVLYGLAGAGAIGAGVITILAPGTIVADVAASPLTAHLAREEGAAFVFIGLMAIWCLRHFDQRRPVHCAFVNTAPFVAFAVTAPRKAAI